MDWMPPSTEEWSKRNQQALQGLLNINQFLPVTGDIQSGLLAAQDVRNQKYGSAALNALGVLPFLPALGGTIAKKVPDILYHGTSPQAAKNIEKAGFDISKSADGTIWFTSNPNIGEVAASAKGAVVKRQLDKKMKLGGWDETDKYSVDELINMGYDGLKLPSGDGEITYQIFYPEKLKKIK